MSGGRGARDRPLTYRGEHDMALTYLPREVVKVGTTAYLATAVSLGEDPATTPASWLPLGGGGGDSDHDGSGADSTAVGTAALAGGDQSTSLGDGADASGEAATVVGQGASGSAFAVTVMGQGATGTQGWSCVYGYAASSDGFNSVVVGREASAPTGADDSVVIGASALVDGVVQGTAVGKSSYVGAQYGTAIGAHADAENQYSTAIGYNADTYGGDFATSLGATASASAAHAIAIGYGANANVAKRCLIRANDVEVENVDGTGTSMIFRDTVTGTRYRISVASGAFVLALA